MLKENPILFGLVTLQKIDHLSTITFALLYDNNTYVIFRMSYILFSK